MPIKEKPARHFPVILFILLFLSLIYCNTLQVPFLFDDKQNIIERSDLYLTRITPDTIVDTLSKEEGTPLYRPISCLSFALNYYFGKHHVFGYHVVNISIHLITAFVLFKTLCLLLPLGKIRFTPQEIVFIAALATILWGAHPIQTQAITYIVQRMASLAAMFYIMGIWSYLKFREGGIRSNWKRATTWFMLASISFAAGVLSKENAAFFPVAILLIELFFFGGYEKIRRNLPLSACMALALLVIPLAIGYFFLHIDGLDKILSGYAIRPFTATQRLLTESRVLFLYISQIFYPIPSRFSLVHYLPLSESLFSPVSTFWAIAGIGIGVFVSFLIGRKYPLIAFPIVFYFSHHIVESSIVPLEIIYEHRNYLPSLFFFLPASIGAVKILSHYRKNNRFLFSSVCIFVTAIVFLFGMAAHLRNQEWQSEKVFWAKELEAAPELIRPYLGMGWQYTRQNSMNLDAAYHYFHKGADQKEYFRKFERADLWLNIARLHRDRHEYSKAKLAVQQCLMLYQQEIEASSYLIKRRDVKCHLAEIYYMLADICSVINEAEAIIFIEKAIQLNGLSYYYNEKAIYLIKANQHDAALRAVQNAFNKSVRSGAGDELFLAAYLYTHRGNWAKGNWFYQLYMKTNPAYTADFQPVYLFLAENRYLAGDECRGDQYLQKFIDGASLQQIFSTLNKIENHYPKTLPFISEGLIANKLKNILSEMAQDI